MIFWFKWLLIVIIGLPLLTYLLLILINISDEDKSNRVIEFETFLAKKVTVDDPDNGFVYAMGLSANGDDDFYSIGVKRIDQANITKPVVNNISKQDEFDFLTIDETFKALTKGCGQLTQLTQLSKACAENLQSKSQGVDNFLVSSTILLQRYQKMINQNVWYESIQENIYNIPPLSPWHISHKVFLLYVWQQASQGNIELATTLLQQDNIFLRRVMSSTHYLIHFAFTVELAQQHYAWGALALKSKLVERLTYDNLTTENNEKAIPSVWFYSYRETDFSFDKIIMGEWQFSRSTLQQMYSIDDWNLMFIRPVFNLQSTLNLNAKLLVESVKSKQNSEMIIPTTNECNQKFSFALFKWYSYNPVGKLLICTGPPNLNYYFDKINDLEKLRLATLRSLQAN